jgi:hypothetical protein
MKIYRVQHKEYGYGPYSYLWNNIEGCDEYLKIRAEIIDDHSNISTHPAPCDDDMKSFLYGKYYYGFESLEMLHNWFSGWLQTLYKFGFKIYELEVDSEYVEFGSKQVAFIKSQARNYKDITSHCY